MAEDDEEADIGLISGIIRAKSMHWLFIPKRFNVKKVFLGLIVAVILIFIGYNLRGLDDDTRTHAIPSNAKLKIPDFCAADSMSISQSINNIFQSDPLEEKTLALKSKTRNPGRVLIIPKSSFSKANRAVNELLLAHRIGSKSSIAGKNLPDLIKMTRNLGKYCVIIFEDYRTYLEMDPWNREILDKYCQTYKVGIIAFIPTEEKSKLVDKSRKIKSLPVIQKYNNITRLEILKDSPVLSITKPGSLTIQKDEKSWVTLPTTDDYNYEPIAMGYFSSSNKSSPTVLLDKGLQDGIHKVLIGNGIARHWLYKILFPDALKYLSNGLFNFPLQRYILVDIDDIFVGANRLKRIDVQALIESQERISTYVPGFQYNIGFSGKPFKSGTIEENLADEMLIENRHKFWWFPHMWNHNKAHTIDDVKELEKLMTKNLNFAKEHDIPLDNNYSIAPHHSGVYPIHEPLYQAWKQIFNISLTSTEEYPHLKYPHVRPPYVRKGFVYQDIKVLPRQTCGLYTKHLYLKDYPKDPPDPESLDRSIQGGELFQTIVNNPISIFMSHMPNYGFDQLAQYTFESVVKMLKCWTNLDLQTKHPQELGNLYFNMFPEEMTPIWGRPCDDPRHVEIWSKSKSCDRLPDFLVVGPQKTGTTALYSFLQVHPAIQSNFQSPKSFEELQFFSNSENYAKGIDWYMDFFPKRTPSHGSNKTFLFEKSATYFDKDVVPQRAFSLLNSSKLIVILISPAKRAYSWYHHMRAHEDETAMSYTFHEVVTANPNHSSKALKALQSRCLEPGKYASHLERWLKYYKAQQLFIMDGEKLKKDPVQTMNNLQHFLNIKPIVDYKNLLKYDAKKGFFCPLNHGKIKCLGKGKGRIYAPMEQESLKYLLDYYRLYNENLLKLLQRLGYAIPEWLKEDLNDETD